MAGTFGLHFCKKSLFMPFPAFINSAVFHIFLFFIIEIYLFSTKPPFFLLPFNVSLNCLIILLLFFLHIPIVFIKINMLE